MTTPFLSTSSVSLLDRGKRVESTSTAPKHRTLNSESQWAILTAITSGRWGTNTNLVPTYEKYQMLHSSEAVKVELLLYHNCVSNCHQIALFELLL